MKEKKTEIKRVCMRFHLKADDSLKIEELMRNLRKRGWRKEKARLSDLIMDELFLKADSKFYEEVLNKFTPLEYLFKIKIGS